MTLSNIPPLDEAVPTKGVVWSVNSYKREDNPDPKPTDDDARDEDNALWCPSRAAWYQTEADAVKAAWDTVATGLWVVVRRWQNGEVNGIPVVLHKGFYIWEFWE